MMQIIGSFAEFERAMLHERTRNGLVSAREQGRDLPVTVFFFGIGTPEELAAYADAGAARCVFWTTNAERETVERELEDMERAIRAFRGA